MLDMLLTYYRQYFRLSDAEQKELLVFITTPKDPTDFTTMDDLRSWYRGLIKEKELDLFREMGYETTKIGTVIVGRVTHYAIYVYISTYYRLNPGDVAMAENLLRAWTAAHETPNPRKPTKRYIYERWVAMLEITVMLMHMSEFKVKAKPAR